MLCHSVGYENASKGSISTGKSFAERTPRLHVHPLYALMSDLQNEMLAIRFCFCAHYSFVHYCVRIGYNLCF